MRFSPWKIGKYTRWASCWDQYSWLAAIPEDCHLCTKISKRRSIMQATVVFFILVACKTEWVRPVLCSTAVKIKQTTYACEIPAMSLVTHWPCLVRDRAFLPFVLVRSDFVCWFRRWKLRLIELFLAYRSRPMPDRVNDTFLITYQVLPLSNCFKFCIKVLKKKKWTPQ